jgi:hypothetical protein
MRLVLLAAVAALVAASSAGTASAQPVAPYCDEVQQPPPPFKDGADRDCMACQPNVPCSARVSGGMVLYCVHRGGSELWCNAEYPPSGQPGPVRVIPGTPRPAEPKPDDGARPAQ